MSYSETVEMGKDLMAWCNGHSVELITLIAMASIIIVFREKIKEILR